MSKLLQTPHLRKLQLKPYLLLLSTTTAASLPLSSATTPWRRHHHHHHHRFSLLHDHRRRVTPATSRNFSARAFESDGDTAPVAEAADDQVAVENKYPSGEFRFKEFGWWMTFLVKLRMLIAPPWKRVKKGSVLTMKLRGQITDQLKSSFSSGLSLPQICENFEKAAYDPRIAGIYIHIEPLNCGWAKVEEIRRHIIDFKQSVQSVNDKIDAGTRRRSSRNRESLLIGRLYNVRDPVPQPGSLPENTNCKTD